MKYSKVTRSIKDQYRTNMGSTCRINIQDQYTGSILTSNSAIQILTFTSSYS